MKKPNLTLPILFQTLINLNQQRQINLVESNLQLKLHACLGIVFESETTFTFALTTS